MLKIHRNHIAGLLAANLSLFACASAMIAVSTLTPPAQARQTASKFVTPLTDGVQMRCGSGVAWYPVATLSTNHVLKAVEEVDGWVRVEYPVGTPIVVKSEEAEVRGSTAVLTRRSRLRAYNPASPVLEECYKAVFDQFLLPGVEARYIGQVKNREGAAVGLLVEAPAGATGYVLAREVRPATPAEISRVSTAATPVSPPAQPAITPRPAPEPVPAIAQATPSDDAMEPESTEAEGAYADESAITTAHDDQATTPAPSEAQATQAAPVAGRTASLRELDAAFEQMMREPLDASDPNELIEQFRAYQQANADEQSVAMSGDYIASRIAALELRAKAAALSQSLANLDQQVRQASESYGQTLERLSKGREYQVVGRLLPSTVYDGKRLPLMYRLTSIDSSASRTLAYIAPEAALDLDGKVGAIVGVLGESMKDPSAMVSVIRPLSVDVLQASASVDRQD